MYDIIVEKLNQFFDLKFKFFNLQKNLQSLNDRPTRICFSLKPFHEGINHSFRSFRFS